MDDKRSKTWNYGGFKKKPDGSLDTKEMQCGECGKIFQYRYSPFPLTQHLRLYHQGDVDLDKTGTVTEQVTVGSKAKMQGSVKDYFAEGTMGGRVTKEKKPIKYARHILKQKQLRLAVMDLVVKDNRAINIAESEEFSKCIEICDPRMSVPSKQTVTRDIKTVYKKEKAKLIQEFSKVEFFNCTNDAGSTTGARSFVDVNVHYLTNDFYLKKKILRVFEMREAKDADNYRSRIDETMRQFAIAGKVKSYTTDNEATMRKAFSREERNGCFAHIESKSCQVVMKEQEVFLPLMKKLKKIAKKSSKSHKFKYAVQNEQKKRNLQLLVLKQSVPTRFTADWTMARSFLHMGKHSEEVSDEEMQLNFQAINAAMKCGAFTKVELKARFLTEEDRIKLKELVKLLDVLEEGITLMGGEKFSTSSCVLPFVNMLEKLLERDHLMPSYINNFKKDLWKDLRTRFAKNLNVGMLRKASFLDKRYTKLKFLDEADRKEVIAEVLEELKVMQDKARSDAKRKAEEAAQAGPAAKKPRARFLGRGLLNQDSDEEEEEEEYYGTQAERELNNFQAEGKVPDDFSPFDWWRARAAAFPLLSR